MGWVVARVMEAVMEGVGRGTATVVALEAPAVEAETAAGMAAPADAVATNAVVRWGAVWRVVVEVEGAR